MRLRVFGAVAAFLLALPLLAGGCDWNALSQRVVNPTPGDAAAAARGKALYESSCASCHGFRGAGDGPAAQALAYQPPNFTDRLRMINRGDPDLYRFIVQGSSHAGGMPGFGDKLKEREIWDLVNYIRTLYPPRT